MTEIRLEHVSYAYGQERILEDINLQVTSGEVVSILGPSGVGKTTLFNLIAGILEVQSGRIVLDGEENPKGRVSYMLQKDLLLEHKTVLGNIILPLLIQKVDKAEAISRADKILATFQLTAVRDKYPHELSGGMRQRVALLRTYLFGHKLFLLDEAFSALDEMTKMELHAWYLEIHKQLQLTTLIITHSIEEALNLSDLFLLKMRKFRYNSQTRSRFKERGGFVMRFKNTSDHIEAYIKAILDQSGIVELQRSQLADTFQVVPSQINYVIKTRFTESRGYLVESKRGGGGYIRIGRIEFSSHHEMLRELLYSIGERVSQEIYEDILQLLVEQELMTKQEMNLLESVALDRVLGEEAPVVRANMLRQIIQEVDRKGK